MFQPPCASTDPVAAASQVVSALGDAFDDEGPYSREMTTQVLDALGTCVTYLRTCLGPAQSAAIPDSATLAAVLLALHITCTQLHAGLQPALRGIGSGRPTRRRSPSLGSPPCAWRCRVPATRCWSPPIGSPTPTTRPPTQRRNRTVSPVHQPPARSDRETR